MCQSKEKYVKEMLTLILTSVGDIGNNLSNSCNKILSDDIIYRDLSDDRVIKRIIEKIQKIMNLSKCNLDEYINQILINFNNLKNHKFNENIMENEEVSLPNEYEIQANVKQNDNAELNISNNLIYFENESLIFNKKSETLVKQDSCLKPSCCFVSLIALPTHFENFMKKHSITKIYNKDGQLLCKNKQICNKQSFETFCKIKKKSQNKKNMLKEKNDSNIVNISHKTGDFSSFSDMSSDNSSSDVIDWETSESANETFNEYYNKLKYFLSPSSSKSDKSVTTKYKNKPQKSFNIDTNIIDTSDSTVSGISELSKNISNTKEFSLKNTLKLRKSKKSEQNINRNGDLNFTTKKNSKIRRKTSNSGVVEKENSLKNNEPDNQNKTRTDSDVSSSRIIEFLSDTDDEKVISNTNINTKRKLFNSFENNRNKGKTTKKLKIEFSEHKEYESN